MEMGNVLFYAKFQTIIKDEYINNDMLKGQRFWCIYKKAGKKIPVKRIERRQENYALTAFYDNKL